MYLLEIDRLAAMLVRIFFIVVVGELFIPEICALYFIEITDKADRTGTIRLFECVNAPKEPIDPERLPSPLRKTPGSPKRSELPTLNDVMCREAPQGRRRHIYENANFYLVSNLAIEGGKRIFTSLKTQQVALLSQVQADTILLGVKIFGRNGNDYPAIVEKGYNDATLTSLREKCKDALIATNVLDEEDLNEFVLYMGVSNFNAFLHPTEKLIDQFHLFGRVLERTRNLYYKSMSFQPGSDELQRKRARREAAAAVAFLSQKVLDPCLVLANSGIESEEADTQCKNMCKFLAAGFESNEVPSISPCGGSMNDGFCDNQNRCWCKKENIMYRMDLPASYMRMVQCSNELRMGIAKQFIRSRLAYLPSMLKSLTFRKGSPSKSSKKRSPKA